jgi:glyoxylase-like metal-dependent hydrolase (beta-lactamase superfamily II)
MTQVHVFASAEAAFFVNSFVIETPNALVLVDTQFLNSSAEQLCEFIRQRAKPLRAIVITHPHPDHFNGTAVVLSRWPGVPVHATSATLDVIRQTEAAKRAAWTPRYGADYPATTAYPDHIVEPGQALFVDGVELQIDDLGAGESADITVVYLPQSRQLIASDLLYHQVHPWLAEGRTAQWLEQIEVVHARYSDAVEVFAGHGKPAGREALLGQAEYLRSVRERIRHGVADLRNVQPMEQKAIGDWVRTRYPGYPLEMLIDMNTEGVARELAA